MATRPPRSPRELREVLAAAGITLRRSLGQHYLADGNLRDALVKDAGVTPGEVLLEVGVGLGVLTEGLIAAGAAVFGVELDEAVLNLALSLLGEEAERMDAEVTPEHAAERLLTRRAGRGHAVLLAANILRRKALDERVDHTLTAVRAQAADARLRLVANLPYQVASPLIVSVLEWRPSVEDRRGFDGVAVMVQREVAERIVAKPGTPAYGGLSVLCQAHAAFRIARRIPPTVFAPRPNVDSAFVVATAHDPAAPAPLGLTERSYEAFKSVVHAAFQYRRKRLRKALELGTALPEDVRRQAFQATGIDPERRGEELAPADFAAIADAVAEPA